MMRILLRNTQTGLFFQGPGQWTSSVEEARAFGQGSQAITLSLELNLQHVEVYFAFSDPQYNIHLPLANAS